MACADITVHVKSYSPRIHGNSWGIRYEADVVESYIKIDPAACAVKLQVFISMLRHCPYLAEGILTLQKEAEATAIPQILSVQKIVVILDANRDR